MFKLSYILNGTFGSMEFKSLKEMNSWIQTQYAQYEELQVIGVYDK